MAAGKEVAEVAIRCMVAVEILEVVVVASTSQMTIMVTITTFLEKVMHQEVVDVATSTITTVEVVT